MNKLYSDNVLLNNNGFDAPKSDLSTLEEVKERVAAHGRAKIADIKSTGDYHYFLWRDAKRLVELLEEANAKINELTQDNLKGCDAEPHQHSTLEVIAQIPITVGDKEFLIDVPVALELVVK